MSAIYILLATLPLCLAQFDPNALNQNFGSGGFGTSGTQNNFTGNFDPNGANSGLGTTNNIGINGFGPGSGFDSGSGFGSGSGTGTGGVRDGSTSGGTFDPNQFLSGGGTSGKFDPNSLNSFGVMNGTSAFGKK